MNFSSVHHEGISIAPKKRKSYAFDANQQAESLIHWEQCYNQHSRGRFTGYLDEITLGGMHLFEEFTSQTLLQQCCVNENSVWIGFSLQPQRPKINGNLIEEGQMMIRPSGVEFELFTPEAFHIFGLVLDKQALSQELGELDPAFWLGEASSMLVTEPDVYASYELSKLIRLLLSEDGPLNVSLPKGVYQQRLLRLKPLIRSKIVDLLSQTPTGVHEVLSINPNQKRIIERIRHHVWETGCYPLTISELCNIAYVSRRTLQNAFEQELGVSPMQYLRESRLNDIRRILLGAEKDIVISELAIGYGFFHISTFIEHYKHLFGETPSQTLRRSAAYTHRSFAER